MTTAGNNHSSKLIVRKDADNYTPDAVSKGAESKWLENDGTRMRVVVYPSGYEADHVCYDGHSFYVAAGTIKIKLGEEITEWNEGDAFIIPDDVPHVVFNPNQKDAKVVVVDHQNS